MERLQLTWIYLICGYGLEFRELLSTWSELVDANSANMTFLERLL